VGPSERGQVDGNLVPDGVPAVELRNGCPFNRTRPQIEGLVDAMRPQPGEREVLQSIGRFSDPSVSRRRHTVDMEVGPWRGWRNDH